MRSFLIITTMLLIAAIGGGCSAMKTREVVEVKVPVVQPWPEPPKFERPKLELDYITDKDFKDRNYDKIVKSLEITLQQLMDYSIKLETALDAYRQPSKKSSAQ